MTVDPEDHLPLIKGQKRGPFGHEMPKFLVRHFSDASPTLVRRAKFALCLRSGEGRTRSRKDPAEAAFRQLPPFLSFGPTGAEISSRLGRSRRLSVGPRR